MAATGWPDVAIALITALSSIIIVFIPKYFEYKMSKEKKTESEDVDLKLENDTQQSYARINGIVTKTNENDADGSWRYEYNEHRDIYELDIQIVEYIDEDKISRRFEALRSRARSGFWPDDEIFIHVAEMNEFTEDEEYRVYVFAYGDKEKLEAAILTDTTENEELYKSLLDLPTSELIENVMDVIESSEDIIYGETLNAIFGYMEDSTA